MPRRNPSTKLAIAAREVLLRRAGLAAVAEWEKQHGTLIDEEMEAARRSVREQLRTGAGLRGKP